MTLFSVRDLKAKAGTQPVEAALHVQIETVQLKSARSGNDYLELRLADATDSFALRLWSDSAAFPFASRMLARQFIAVQASWTQNSFGLDGKNVELRQLEKEEVTALLAGPEELRNKQATDYASIVELCASMQDPRLKGLSERFLDEFGERFRRTGAARDYHHARRGGLVEHVAQMMRTAAAIASAYPMLNRDLLLAGVLFHDCGKLWENVYEPQGFSMPYQERGELLGHISVGIELVNTLWRNVAESPENVVLWPTLSPTSEDVRLHLLHLIASHHGEMQFGSPVWPKTPEAIVLHHVDNIDAKLEMMIDGYATSAHLGPRIQERRRPLPGNLVTPLPSLIPIETVEGETANPLP